MVILLIGIVVVVQRITVVELLERIHLLVEPFVIIVLLDRPNLIPLKHLRLH